MTFSHVMMAALASSSHDASSIINGTLLFVRLRQSKKGQHEVLVMLHHLNSK